MQDKWKVAGNAYYKEIVDAETGELFTGGLDRIAADLNELERYREAMRWRLVGEEWPGDYQGCDIKGRDGRVFRDFCLDPGGMVWLHYPGGNVYKKLRDVEYWRPAPADVPKEEMCKITTPRCLCHTRREWQLIVFHLELSGHKQLAARISNRIVTSSSETPGIYLDAGELDLAEEAANRVGIIPKELDNDLA